MTRVERGKHLRRKRLKNIVVIMGISLFSGIATSSIYSRTLEKNISNEEGYIPPYDMPYYQDNEESTNSNAVIYYYEKDKKNRYDEYQKLHPELEMEEVIWRVNAGIDKPHYEDYVEIIDVDKEILLVNKYNKLPDDFKPKELVKLNSGPLVTPETKIAYEQMVNDAKSEGYSIRAVSAYRSIQYQVDVYNRYLNKDPQEVVDTYSARPGFSEHHTGRTIDLDSEYSSMSEFGNTKEAAWVAENAYKYGFIIRYPKGLEDITGYVYEPWHITYVGKEIATQMKNLGIDTLEEYWVKYVDYQEN